ASTIIMAQAFAQSIFWGFDYHAKSIEWARRAAEKAGVADRVTFEVAPASRHPGTGYDPVTFFDFVHDMGDPFALDAIAARLDQVVEGHGAARAGLEMALHDWIGKRLGQPTWKLLGLDPARCPRSCVTLGMASPEEMERKLDTVRDFPLIKVKLGAPGDVENLKRIRAGYKGKLQVDANTAWNAADAVRVLRQIEPLQIELVEQPVPRGDLDGLQWVRERSPISVFADESAHTLADIGQLAGRVDGVNLKIMKSGGVREMQRMIHAARAHGMKVMLGSMVESSLALSAAAQLAPLVDYLDLDGHWLVKDDPFDGAPRERGEIR